MTKRTKKIGKKERGRTGLPSLSSPSSFSSLSPSKKLTVSDLRSMKGRREKIVSLTAYDYWTARLLDEGGVPLLLVGDSLGMVMLGYPNTLPVTMDEMIHHTKAVVRGVKRAVVVGDMPFMSYQASVGRAVAEAGRFVKEGGADAVKLEGGEPVFKQVRAIVQSGVPVMGHLGLTPQSILTLGGYRVQGRESAVASRMKKEALGLQEAGAFSLVLECVPAALAQEITASLEIPTIGIGAGRYCDGQILVTHDLLGLTTWFKQPKFTKRYVDLPKIIHQAVAEFAKDIRQSKFPGDKHSY